MTKRRIRQTRQDSDGDITAVLFDGNQRFTSVERAIPMARRGEIERVHVVDRAGVKPHLRSNPDGQIGNNLDEMAG